MRVDGVDTETGKHRPRQLGTYPSQRAAKTAASKAAADADVGGERGTLGWLVDRWVASRTDVGEGTRSQYRWAADHIKEGIGSLRLDRLDRDDIATWFETLAGAGHFARRSIQIMRTVLRAALEDAVEEGTLRRNPARRVPMPRAVAKVAKAKETEAWDEAEVRRFVDAVGEHRWSGPMVLLVLYGLRRSELLALRWSDLDLKAGRVVIDEGLVSVRGKQVWTEGKNARSRRTIPIDKATAAALVDHRRFQAEERLLAGPDWEDWDLVVATKTGRPIDPTNFSQTLARVIKAADLPTLSSHGLRHTAATHMVRQAKDVGELRAVADILGHSPDMLMRVYAHAMPDSLQAVADRIGKRSGGRVGLGQAVADLDAERRS
ncbi:MAG: site-specific integrase [Acidimicrobiia bacterium]|nr:site-specific integrase [Acidimicrobiia bacterium]